MLLVLCVVYRRFRRKYNVSDSNLRSGFVTRYHSNVTNLLVLFLS